jgi:hypothetical protein
MDVHPREQIQFDASDEAQVRQRELKARRREKADRDVVASLLSSPDGRAWAWAKLASTHIYETSFSSDPIAMAFREGERNIGLQFLSEISRTSPESLILMMKERSDG